MFQLIQTAIIGYNHFMCIPQKQEHFNALETLKVNAVKPPDKLFLCLNTKMTDGKCTFSWIDNKTCEHSNSFTCFIA